MGEKRNDTGSPRFYYDKSHEKLRKCLAGRRRMIGAKEGFLFLILSLRSLY